MSLLRVSYLKSLSRKNHLRLGRHHQLRGQHDVGHGAVGGEGDGHGQRVVQADGVGGAEADRRRHGDGVHDARRRALEGHVVELELTRHLIAEDDLRERKWCSVKITNSISLRASQCQQLPRPTSPIPL